MDIKENKTEKRNLPYLDLLNNVTSYKVDIIKQTAKEDRKFLGMINKTNPDPIKFSDESKKFAFNSLDDKFIIPKYIHEECYWSKMNK